jgi:hypothetical protein
MAASLNNTPRSAPPSDTHSLRSPEWGCGGRDYLLLAGGCGRRRADQPRRIPRRHSERRVVEQGQRLESRLGQCPEPGWAAGRIRQRRLGRRGSRVPGGHHDPRQATNTAGSVVSSCGRPPRTPKPPAASGFTSTLNRTLLGSNPEACGFQRPTPVSSICRQVELPDGSQATCPHARPAAPKGTACGQIGSARWRTVSGTGVTRRDPGRGGASVPRPAGAVGAAALARVCMSVGGLSVGCGGTPDASMRMVRRGMRLDLQGACSAESLALGRHGELRAGPGGHGSERQTLPTWEESARSLFAALRRLRRRTVA